MPLEKVMRFAHAVLAERTRVVDEAIRARARRPGEGTPVPFGELIAERLGRHAVDPATVRWDAYRRQDGGWTVTAAFTAIEQDRLARFSFGLTNRTVSALDALAADLLSDRPVRALLPPDPDPVAELAELGPVRLSAVPDQPDPEPDADESGAGGDARGAAVSAAEGAHPADPGGHRRRAVRPGGLRRPGDRLAGASRCRWSWPSRTLSRTRAGEGRHRRGSRRSEKPRMPSWDDILLGVRHKD